MKKIERKIAKKIMKILSLEFGCRKKKKSHGMNTMKEENNVSFKKSF